MRTNSGTGYSAACATNKYGRFLVLLARWRASVYKMMYQDLLVYFSLYISLYILYFFILDEGGKRTFETIVVYCRTQNNLLPLTFLMGFYLRIVIERWWSQCLQVPRPDPVAVYVCSLLRGSDAISRLMRRTIMRYVCLSICMVFVKISPPAKRRFPTYQKYVDGGILLPNERDVIEKLEAKFPNVSKHLVPLAWACSILVRGRNEGRIRDDFALRTLIDSISRLRKKCMKLMQYHAVTIPLVYTQVMTLAVYTYFMGALMGRQIIETHGNFHENSAMNVLFLIFPMIEFFFYVGWLKVAEVIMWPFGDDDQDIAINFLIDRNMRMSYIIVDEMYDTYPSLLKDQYWDDVSPDTLPYHLVERHSRASRFSRLPSLFSHRRSVKNDNAKHYTSLESVYTVSRQYSAATSATNISDSKNTTTSSTHDSTSVTSFATLDNVSTSTVYYSLEDLHRSEQGGAENIVTVEDVPDDEMTQPAADDDDADEPIVNRDDDEDDDVEETVLNVINYMKE